MGSVNLASRAARRQPVASLSFLEESSRICSAMKPLPFCHGRRGHGNASTAGQLADLRSSSMQVRRESAAWFTRQHPRPHPVLTMMRSPSRDSASRSNPVRSQLIAASFSNSGPSVSSCTVTLEDVLQFWYRDVDAEKNVFASKSWFMGGPDFDREVEMKFGECVNLAAEGALDGWKDSVRGRLALVIIFDQFPRNIYRKSPKAYAYDEIARKITLETIEQGLDKELNATERTFLYMPLIHSENLQDHDIAATVFKGLADEYSDNEHLHKYLLKTLEFEEKHRAVLELFGRYPSRNEDLGRQSTPKELEHLSKGASW
ncbi:hypothetical protein Mapa_000217 [Marchantia paleacea]|nr:hypothetical protein Mapa_000217 [Marchantia paleacea]